MLVSSVCHVDLDPSHRPPRNGSVVRWFLRDFFLAGDAPNAWRAAYQDGLEPKDLLFYFQTSMSGKSQSCLEVLEGV